MTDAVKCQMSDVKCSVNLNRTKLIIFGITGLFVAILIFALVFGTKQSPQTQVVGDILVWGVIDEPDIINQFVVEFKKSYPKVNITYQKKSANTYEKDLINALAAGRGPDIFYIHNTWLPKHADKIFPDYEEYMTVNSFRDTFVDVAYNDFVLGDEIYALPLYVDTLALFYNKDIFNSVGIANPPSTWEGLLSMVPSLTKKDSSGGISRSAIAMGTAKNIDKATDILSLLMLQSGVKMFDEERMQTTFDQRTMENDIEYPSGQQSLEFYVNFSNAKKSVYTWNNQMPYSIDAFLEGKTAMMINYSYQVENLRSRAPHLKFGVSLAPQPKGAQQSVNYADYWGLTVSKTSKYPDVAWFFAHYLMEKEQSTAYIKMASKPTARRDLVNTQRNQERELGIFAQQSLSAYSWYQPDNIAVSKIFENMIELTASGVSALSAITDAARKIDLLIPHP